MDISDNNRLSEARERYHQKGEELRRNFESEKKNLERTHEARESNQRQVYSDSKRDLENTMQKVSDNQAAYTKEEIARQQLDYNNQIRTAREQFEKDATGDRNKFSERLNNLKESFDRNNRLNEAQNTEKYDNTTGRLQGLIKNGRNDHTREMNQLQENANNNYQNYRAQVIDDTKNLIKHKEEEKHEIVRQSNTAQDKLKEKLTGEMESINLARDAQLSQMKNDQQAQIGQVHSVHGAESDSMIENYNHLMALNQQNSDYEKKGIVLSNEDKMHAREKEYNKELNNLERRVVTMANSGGRGDEARHELDRTKRANEDRIRKMKGTLENTIVSQTADKAHMMDAAQNTLRQQALLNYKHQDLKDKQHAADAAKQTDAFRQERDKISEELTGELKTHQYNASKSLTDERMSNKAKHNSQRVDYAQRMNVMSEKNLQTIASIKEEQKRDKTAFIEKAKRDVFEAKEELKDEVNSRLMKTVDVHQVKVDHLENDKERLIANYENRLTNLSKKSVSSEQQRTLIEEQRRQEDMRTAKRIQEEKDFETAKVIQSLRKEFDKNLNEIGHSNEMKINKMSKRYEEVIDRMSKENNIEQHRRDTQARENYERLVKSNELQKSEIENKYELKIQKMKDAVNRAREVASTRSETTQTFNLEGEDDSA